MYICGHSVLLKQPFTVNAGKISLPVLSCIPLQLWNALQTAEVCPLLVQSPQSFWNTLAMTSICLRNGRHVHANYETRIRLAKHKSIFRAQSTNRTSFPHVLWPRPPSFIGLVLVPLDAPPFSRLTCMFHYFCFSHYLKYYFIYLLWNSNKWIIDL